MDGCTGEMRKNLIKQEANRRANSTRAARTACAQSSNFPGTCRRSKACSRCLFLITARARSKARMEEESTACSDGKQMSDLEEGKEKYQGTASEEKNHRLYSVFLKQKSTSASGGRPLFV